MHQSVNEDIDLSLSGPSMDQVLPDWICVPPNGRVQANKANKANKANGGHISRVCALIGLWNSIENNVKKRNLFPEIIN